ncbi:MAG: LD-carboxypeptidase [Nitrospiraceae bacterium]|nr:LD-carboxypeptidase [Nitrospiraceae bacterium]
MAIFSPSSPPDSKKMDLGLQIIKERAPYLEIVRNGFPDQIEGMASLPYLARTDQAQAKEFTRLILDPSLDIIWCIRGGYGSLRWLDMVAWDQIRGSAPIVIGFSDVTFLHAALSHVGLVLSIHGPLVSTLPSTSESARKALWRCLDHGKFPCLSGIPFSPGMARGPVIGGNLTCITHLIGTGYEPRWDGAILLIEDLNEAHYRLDRMLTQLLITGRLSRLAGIAVGYLLGPDKSDRLLGEILQDRLCSLRIPIVLDVPVGHSPQNYPVLLGGNYIIDGDRGILRPMEAISMHQSP